MGTASCASGSSVIGNRALRTFINMLNIEFLVFALVDFSRSSPFFAPEGGVHYISTGAAHLDLISIFNAVTCMLVLACAFFSIELCDLQRALALIFTIYCTSCHIDTLRVLPETQDALYHRVWKSCVHCTPFPCPARYWRDRILVLRIQGIHRHRYASC